jgi:hypothetical protein
MKYDYMLLAIFLMLMWGIGGLLLGFLISTVWSRRKSKLTL